MAYSRDHEQSCPLPVEPGVLSFYLPGSSSAADFLVDVPWDNCKLTYATVTTLVASATAAVEIDIELDAASGTELMTGTVVSGTAVGAQTEFTYTSESSSNNLKDTNNLNFEVAGDATWQGMVYCYFERNTI